MYINDLAATLVAQDRFGPPPAYIRSGRNLHFMKGMSGYARSFIAVVVATGIGCMAYGVLHPAPTELVRFFCYLGIALMASGMKVRLPGINGTMSVSFLFVLLGVLDLTYPETITLAAVATLVQCYWKLRRKPHWIQVLFNLCSTTLAAGAAYGLYHFAALHLEHSFAPVLLVFAACTYFLCNTVPVAIVIALTEHKSLAKIWKECYFWSFPYYLIGAGIAGVVSWTNRALSWQMSLLVLPVVYAMYRSYRLYLGKLENEKKHVEEMASLHMRTIEALALAIEAKDQTTHDHLQRVRVYALEIAKSLRVTDEEMEALKAAALLHDIGKLAVPEHIISKPGRLTPEEFEKMKIHPIVGAEILEQVQFPYPVAPIVRAHHEKWDGSGYPHGLKNEEIPIGARILACVDCLDALASDRQYRKALPLDEAMAQVTLESGKSFDPRVVAELQRRYRELEVMAQNAEAVKRAKLSTDVKVERGTAPAAGFAQEQKTSQRDAAATLSTDFRSSIAAARQEVQMLFELSQDLGNSLSVDETLSVLAVRLKRLVPYDSIAIYLHKGDKLIPEFVSGDNFRLFSSLEIPMGHGLSGWVAQNCKPILNGNPSVEPGYLDDPSRFSTLRSALAVPLEGLSGVVGVLALYRAEADAFSRDNLRILGAVSSKLGIAVENALKYRLAENSASTDYLTGMPNARSLFLQLDAEVARCKRSGESVAVLVCDLDGFKAINDRFGHLEGNRVLRDFAARLKECCREYDYIGRMGGDEFVIVAPGLAAHDVAEKTRRLEKIAQEIGYAVTGDNSLSVSVGAAMFPEDGEDAERLLSEADRRMYHVKQQHHKQPRVPVPVLEFPHYAKQTAAVVN